MLKLGNKIKWLLVPALVLSLVLSSFVWNWPVNTTSKIDQTQEAPGQLLGATTCGFGSLIADGDCRGYLRVSDTSPWLVPNDWNAASNSIEVIGAGGGGGNSNVATQGGAGAGGGGYSRINNLTFAAASTSISFSVGASGSGGASGGANKGSNGGHTFFGKTTFALCSTAGATICVSAEGGEGGPAVNTTASASAGNTASASGTVKNAGGDGGGNVGGTTPDGSTGGGGAGGRGGAGKASATVTGTTNIGGSGGGGAGGGSATKGVINSAGTGGAGGSGPTGTAGGAAGTPGTAGSNGSGGGSGSNGATGTGGNGGSGQEWDSTHGSGAGGGGAGDSAATGGNGGAYGGGGGGGQSCTTATCRGGDGLIVITYRASAIVTKFMEPGGDATFNAVASTSGGLWSSITGTPTIATDFVHGSHIKSIANAINTNNHVNTSAGTVSDNGTRLSYYIYINAMPASANHTHCVLLTAAGGLVVAQIGLTSAGVLRLYRSSLVQIGTDGPTLSTGQWYRISLAYTVTSTTVNRFELFVDGVSAISVTNATLVNTSSSKINWGPSGADTAEDVRYSDFYADNASTLTDPGNIWVTAKRPNANGTTNGYTTQIGSGGSSYGTGHSPQVNERALSTTNGWSMIGAGSAVTEEYNIESASAGDINISSATIVDYMGWVSTKALVGETVNVIVNGVNFAQAITSSITVYSKFAGSTTYPAGTGTDIGEQTDTSLTTVSLYEAGIVVAYIPAAAAGTPTRPDDFIQIQVNYGDIKESARAET